ncbi:hypothetical protein M422DRAFT_42501 [Sphaerobolus stellatus SS14]|nr:hypothetical protein M422DRAFT_42501 [Sphaerobolus stellatus SS14]
MSTSLKPPSSSKNDFSIFDDDDEGWQDMPIVRGDDFANGLDEEDQKKYKYVKPEKSGSATKGNATGNLIDFDDYGNEWRSKLENDEEEYTRLRLDEDNETEDVHLRTKYLFDEDKAMTPLSQMQATKNLLTEAQRIAYVALCALAIKEMNDRLKKVNAKGLKSAIASQELWGLKIMGRLYYHMELATPEQKMIESLAVHGVEATDLVPSLMTTHTVANPEYDPAEAQRAEEERHKNGPSLDDDSDDESDTQTLVGFSTTQTTTATTPTVPATPATAIAQQKTTTNVLQPTATSAMPGVSTTLSATDVNVTLDIRWTVLCDLFLLLIADSVYDSRSRVLLETVALKLGLGWIDVVKFEKRVTDALEIQEGVEKMEQQDIIDGRMKSAKKRRYVMMGLATIGGGLVIGLSAGLLAPVIGAGLGAAFTTIGVTGTTSFLTGVGGAALITTGGAITGSGIAVKGMARRTRQVRTFELLPLHNNKRVNCIITVPGFMNGIQDDVRLPFSVLDPIVGDVFSVRWEPEMMEETGNALKILTGEILSQIGTTVLQATVMTTLMSALTWPIVLTKLGYLIDNPWSNALDRAKAAGAVLADILLRRNLGVRPIMLIGFSLGARVIFYALLELAKQKAYGIVQDVFLLGATVTAPTRSWLEVRGVVPGRFVNGYARNDWVLNYLFRATSGGLNTVAGLRPVENIPGLENVDVTDKISGHNSYRTFMPLILDELGFPVTADYFDEPEEPDMEEDREVIREGEESNKKKGWFSRNKETPKKSSYVQRPPSSLNMPSKSSSPSIDDLPERLAHPSQPGTPDEAPSRDSLSIPVRAGFDFKAIQEMLQEEGIEQKDELEGMAPEIPANIPPPVVPPPASRTTSAPKLQQSEVEPISYSPTDTMRNHSSIAESDLSQAFTRSLSFNDAQERDQQSLSLEPEPPLNEYTPTGRFNFQPPAPSVSFGSTDGAIWGSSLDAAPPFSSISTNPFASPADTRLPFNNGSEESRTISGFGSYGGGVGVGVGVSGGGADPFAASPSAGISFGGADGSVSALGDPWASTADVANKNKKPSYTANPW